MNTLEEKKEWITPVLNEESIEQGTTLTCGGATSDGGAHSYAVC